MARKIRAREVLRLLESGMSRNATARSQGMSGHSVQAVSEAAEAAGIGWAGAEGMLDAEVNLNLPRFRLHPYAAIGWRSSSGQLARSNSSGLRYPSPECVLTLL